MKMNRLACNSGFAKGFFICPRATGSDSEHSQNRRPPRAFVTGGASKNIVGHNSALAIGRAGQRNDAPGAGNGIAHFDGISDGPDIRVIGLQMLVDTNSTHRAKFQTGVFGESRFRPNTQSENDKIRREAFAALEHDNGSARFFADCGASNKATGSLR